jgi:hypothetical protein
MLFRTKSDWYIQLNGTNIVGDVEGYKGTRGEIGVLYTPERVFTMLNEKGNPCDKQALSRMVRRCIKREDLDFPEDGKYADQYAEIYDGMTWRTEMLQFLGISEYLPVIQQKDSELLANLDVEYEDFQRPRDLFK